MEHNSASVGGTRRTLPLYMVMALSVVMLALCAGLGNGLVVYHLDRANDLNNAHLVQAEVAGDRLTSLVRDIDTVSNQFLPLMQSSHEMSQTSQWLDAALLRLVLDADGNSKNAARAAMDDVLESRNALEAAWTDSIERKHLERISNSVALLETITGEMIETASPTQLFEMLEEVRAASNALLDTSAAVHARVRAGSEEALSIVHGDATLLEQSIDESLGNAQQLGARFETIGRGALVAALVVVLVAVGAQIYAVRMIRARLSRGVQYLEALAQGELDVDPTDDTADAIGRLIRAMAEIRRALVHKAETAERIAARDLSEVFRTASGRDVLGDALQRMLTNLNDDIGEVAGASDKLARQAQHFASSSDQLARGATEQAASLNQIATSTEEVARQAQVNSGHASKVDELAVEVTERAQSSTSKLGEMRAAMDQMSDASRDIATIVTVIDEIAYQTNLVALNASIEAARAGESGKRFGVVAKEVRSLAQRCREAASGTGKRIESSISTLSSGIRNANETATVLTEIMDSVAEVSDLVREIASSTREQVKGLEMINIGLGEVNAVTKGNSKVASQSVDSSRELADEAEALRSIVAQFKLSGQRAGNLTQGSAVDEALPAEQGAAT